MSEDHFVLRVDALAEGIGRGGEGFRVWGSGLMGESDAAWLELDPKAEFLQSRLNEYYTKPHTSLAGARLGGAGPDCLFNYPESGAISW
jgi:hypothetical protein